MMITSITYSKYKSINPNDNIIYYISNTKQKNVFFKGSNRYNGAMVIKSKSQLPKPGDRDFSIDHIYFIPSTGEAYKYISNNKIITVQKAWDSVPDDKESISVDINVLKSYHNDNMPTSTGPSFGVYIVEELPVRNIKNGLYLVKSKNKSFGNIFSEYVYVNDAWEKVGSTSAELNEEFITDADLSEVLSIYYTKNESDSKYYNKDEINVKVEHLQSLIDAIPEVDLTPYLKVEKFLEALEMYYTSEEVDEKIKALNIDDLRTQLGELSENLENNYYNSADIDTLIEELKGRLDNLPNFSDYVTTAGFNSYKDEADELYLKKEDYSQIVVNDITQDQISEYISTKFNEFQNGLLNS